MAAPTTTYQMWKRLAGRPGGTRLFSAAAMVRVPYFASIVPHVVRMEPGFAEVTVPKWFFVTTICTPCTRSRLQRRRDRHGHADGGHGAVQPPLDPQGDERSVSGEGHHVSRAQARLDPPDFTAITEGTELVVPVSVIDRAGTEVVHADITTWVTPAS